MAQSPTSQQLQQVKKEQESTQMRGPVAVPTAKRCYVSMATGALAQDKSHLTWRTVCIMVGGTQQVLEQQSCLSLCVRACMHACYSCMHAGGPSMPKLHLNIATMGMEQEVKTHHHSDVARCALSSSVSHAPRTKDSSKGSKKNSV